MSLLSQFITFIFLRKCLNITILATRKIILLSPAFPSFFFEPHFTIERYFPSMIISNEKLARTFLFRFAFSSFPFLFNRGSETGGRGRYFVYPPCFSPTPQFRVNSNPYLLIAHIVQWISITSANYLIGRFSAKNFPLISRYYFSLRKLPALSCSRRYFKSVFCFSPFWWITSQILICP